MKKTILTIALCCALLLCTACSPTGAASSQPESSTESSVGSSTESSGDVPVDGVAYKAIYGKVSGMTGNEMDFSLAKDPYADTAPAGGAGEEGGVTAGIAMTPAMGAEEAEAAAEPPKMQLEYTGETQSYQVSAGVKITASNGGEVQLDSISKGSVLMLLMQDEKITEIIILE